MIKPVFENIKNVITAELLLAKKSIWIASAYFSDTDIFKVLLLLAKRGVELKILVADEPMNLFNSKINFQEIIDCGGVFLLANGTNNNSLMHHKFCIIDDEKVITGSYNYTLRAANNNIENIVIINESQVTKEYKEEFERVENLFANKQFQWNEEVVLSGFLEIDRITKGFHPSELILIAGYSNNGHDLLSINILLQATKMFGIPVAHIATNKTNEQVAKRILSIESEVTLNRMRLGKLEDYEHHAIHDATESIKTLPIDFQDYVSTIDEVENRCKLFKYKGSKLIIIDGIEFFLDLSGSDFAEENNRIVLERLKKLARLIRLPLIINLELLTSVKKPKNYYQIKPNLIDVGIAGDYSDTVVLVHRDECYGVLEDENGFSKKNIADVIIPKQMFQSTGESQIQFDSIFGKFTSFETFEKPPEDEGQEVASNPMLSEDEPPF